MSTQVDLLEQLLNVLLDQERSLTELVNLAFAEQRAIIHSDYDAMNTVGERMLAVANEIDALDTVREEITSRLGHFESLADLVPLADSLGVEGVGEARERLLAQAERLREAQEENARLILNAVRLRERWLSLLAGLSSPTYGSAGRQELHQARGIVSRSA